MPRQNKNNLEVSYNNRPSRFLVDLNSLNQESEAELEKDKNLNYQKFNFSNHKLNRLAIYGLLRFLFLGIKKLFKKIILILIYLIKITFYSSIGLPVLIRKIISKTRHKEASNFNALTVDMKNEDMAMEQMPPSALKNTTNIKESAPEIEYDNIIKKILKPERGAKQPKIFFGKYAYYKPVAVFAAIAFLCVLPFKTYTQILEIKELKGKVMGAADSAIHEISDAAKAAKDKDFLLADQKFLDAKQNFLIAKNEINDISKLINVLSPLVPNEEFKMAGIAGNILQAGQLSAEMGQCLARAVSSLDYQGEDKLAYIIQVFSGEIEKMDNLSIQLRQNTDNISIDNLPEQYMPAFSSIKEKISLLEMSLNELNDIIKNVKIFLGFEYDTRYLLIFQNNTEMRGSGGFVGSFAMIDFRNGKIKNLEIPGGGSYDTEGGLYDLVRSPEPLQLINPQWHFWDANWWPDWEMSAKKLMWFFEKSNGPTVDGVIGFTPTVMEKILDIIGEIDMSENYGVSISSENFWHITQDIVEEKQITIKNSTDEDIASTTIINIENNPKQIIKDMFQIIIDRLSENLNKDMFLKLLNTTLNSLNEKHILFYFNNEILSQKITEFGWNGKIKDSMYDYLMVVNTNIAGQKTDKVIKEEIILNTEITDEGEVFNTLKIIRQHNGIKHEKYTGVRNVDWMRIYVPQNSELIFAEGFSAPNENYFERPENNWEIDPDILKTEGLAIEHEVSRTKIYKEQNKTVFANWAMVDPGETTTITLKYKLPFRVNTKDAEQGIWDEIKKYINPSQKQIGAYSLLAQKQPGSIGSAFTANLSLPNNLKPIWRYGDQVNKKNGWEINKSLTQDNYWAAIFEIN